MKNGWVYWLCLALLVIGVAPASAAAAEKNVSFDESDFPGQAVEFKLEGSNGYTIYFGAYSDPYIEGNDSRSELGLGILREGDSGVASYRTHAIVSESYIKADLGPYGKVDLVRRPSGRKRTIPVRCTGGDTFTYEPALYEGIVEFRGEHGYTGVEATQVRALPLISSFCGSGSGRGESRSSEERGARLKGTSYAHGRTLKFQVNKNHKRGRALFEAEIRERRDGVSIYRAVEGWLPPASFRYDPDLETATLSPPQPFSGSASLNRVPNSVTALWGGDLAIHFPGRTARLAGPGMNVSLVHACFELFDGPEARSC